MNKIFLKLNTINNSVSSKALFKIISKIIIRETTLDLEKELWKSKELSMRRICLTEALREWVIIPDEHKMDWCTKQVYKLLKKKLPRPDISYHECLYSVLINLCFNKIQS